MLSLRGEDAGGICMIADMEVAKEFISGLPQDDRKKLFNDLLALEDVHRHNAATDYFTIRNLRRLGRGRAARCKRTLRYSNMHSDELVINQYHEQALFRNAYRIEVYYNLHEYGYELVGSILTLLRDLFEPVHSYHVSA
ncbi:hypothetical protein RU97_GL000109 [Enterococcus canis]|uniref:Uncharacterized protein n=2 Tax=Enterococcus canis TaxID=214095 RepID=A0A1L8RJE6_9ENTE|nr:hypothetical protein RU97_GL000109 [Enterococcus canis]